MNAHLKGQLPQGGTGQAGESSPSSSDGGCPSYSGGGKDCVETSVSGEGGKDVAVGVVGGSTPGTPGQTSAREVRVVLSRCSSAASIKSCDGRFYRPESEGGEVTDTDTEETLTNASGGSQASVASGGRKVQKAARPSRADFLRPPKRPLPVEDEYFSDATTFASKSSKASQKAKRGRGRSATTGHYIGKSEAQRELAAARKAQTELELEERILAKEREAREKRAKTGYGVHPGASYEGMPVPEIGKTIDDNLDLIIDMAGKSSNLKGTFQRGFRDAAHNVKAAVGELVRRTVSEETQMLQATNVRLQAELNELKEQVKELRTALGSRRARGEPMETADANVPTSAPNPVAPVVAASYNQQELQAMIKEALREESLSQRAFTRACLAGIEDRLLPERQMRPPLAADLKRKTDEGFKTPEPPKPQRTRKGTKSNRPSSSEPKPGPQKASASANTAAAPAPKPTAPAAPRSATTTAEAEDSLLPATTPANEGWSTVVRRGRKGKKTMPSPAVEKHYAPQNTGRGKGPVKSKEAAPKPSKSAAPRKKSLVPPKTAAVVVTLTEEAAKNGETYESVLRRARQSMGDMAVGPARCRQTQTGARKFEFPGAQSTQQADLFAAKLREAVSDVVKVSRPQKCVGLAISDLDDSVSRAEVVDKIASVGGCLSEDIRAGEIRTGRGGMGALRLQCPIAAAKVVLDKGRLLVGFSSAAVRALEDRPLRCFRCYGVGHTRALCPSMSERTNLCFRCGKEGHKASSCNDKVHCAVCTDCGRPAGHVMGGVKCNPPPKKGKVKAPVRPMTSSTEDRSRKSSRPAEEDRGAMSE